MALNYTITVHQGSDTKTRSGRVANLHELSEVIKEVNSTNKKGEQAIVNITFSEVTQSQIEYEEKLKEMGESNGWI